MRNPGLRDKVGNPCLYSGAPSSVVDIMDAFVQAIKQYPGQQQVTRRVRVMVPGKHFPQLQAAEKAVSYWGTAVEFQ